MRDFTEILDRLEAERDLVISFFAGFSRFEFALIRGGFASGNAHHAVADWPRFAATIQPHFTFDSPDELREAVGYLENHPPHRLALVNNSLTWLVNTVAEDKPHLEKLTVHLRAMRNNLFHGGKYPGTPQTPTERDAKLLRSGVVLLDQLLIQSEQHAPNVKNYFDNTMLPSEDRP